MQKYIIFYKFTDTLLVKSKKVSFSPYITGAVACGVRSADEKLLKENLMS